jgi:hypothetical protein
MYFKSDREEKPKKKPIFGIIVLVAFILFAVVLSRTLNSMSEQENKANNEPQNAGNVEKKMKNASEQTEEDLFEELDKGNFEFIYTINDNGNTTIYSGKSNTNKASIDVTNRGTVKYYKLGDNYLDRNFNVIENPLIYEKFVSLSNLKDLIYFSEFNDEGKGVVSAYDVFKIYYQGFVYDPFNIDDIEDSIVEITKDGNNLTRVKMDFSKAVTYIKNSEYTFIVTLEYSNIGNVGEINIG